MTDHTKQGVESKNQKENGSNITSTSENVDKADMGWRGKAEDINSDVIRKVVEHHYFKILLDQEVKAKTQEYISRWWKIITVIASTVLLVLGGFGAKEYLSFKETVKQIEQQRDIVKEQVEKSNDLLKEAQIAANGAMERVKFVSDFSDKAGLLAQQTNGITTNLMDQLRLRQDELKKEEGQLQTEITTAGTAVKSFKEKEQRIAELKDQITTIKGMIDEKKGVIDTTEKEVTSKKNDVDTVYRRMVETADNLRNDLNFQQELAKAKSSEIVVLRTGSEYKSIVELPDFTESKKEKPRKYKFEFIATRIKNKVDIAVAINSSPSVKYPNLAKAETRDLYPTPFIFRVDSVMVLKVWTAELRFRV